MSKVKVLHFSPHNEICGVGKYQENFMHEFADMNSDIETAFFDSSPYKTRIMNQTELDEVISRLKVDLKQYDIFHIQHEFGLFSGDEFAQIVHAAKSMHKKVVVTMHLSPALAFKRKPRGGIGPRSLVHILRQKRLFGIFKQRHIDPLFHVDMVVSHNNGTTRSLKGFGVDEKKILQYNHPVLGITHPKVVSTEIADNLHKTDGDIVYATVGFMHKYKGIEDAVRALKFLPDNYKLAVIGGMQPISDETNIYNKISDLIDALDLRRRVYITGFIEDDDRLNALIREADICVYPYNNAYYGQVSSGALNLAFANERAVIAYPTDGFKESNEFDQIVLTNAFAYYELAREIKRVDVLTQVDREHLYADKYSWGSTARRLVRAYQSLIK